MAVHGPSVAVVETSSGLRDELVFFLERRGYTTWSAGSAEEFWKLLHRKPADIVLVDIQLPGEDGYSVIEYLRTIGNYGLIVLSAPGERDASLRGLTLGADLYLTRPISFPHLFASIDSLWHRLERMCDERPPESEQNPSPERRWQIDETSGCLLGPSGEAIKLSPKEYTLVSILIESPGAVFSRHSLREMIFPYEDGANDHRVDVIMSRLRKKARAQRLTLPIHSVFGKGLVFGQR